MLLSLHRMGFGRYVLFAIGAGATFFLLLPVVFIALLSFGSSQWLQFPPPSWTLRWYGALLDDPRWFEAIGTSAEIAAIVMLLSIALALPTAFTLVRGRIPGRAAIEAFFTTPLIVPVVIIAVALYAAFLRVGLNGTLLGFVAGHLIVALPFSIICITNALRGFDISVERAAIICGASPLQAIWRVTVPGIWLGIVAGALFSFLASWDEVVVAIFLASPTFRTLPVLMWTTLRQDLTPVIAAVSTVLVLVSIAIMTIIFAIQAREPK